MISYHFILFNTILIRLKSGPQSIKASADGDVFLQDRRHASAGHLVSAHNIKRIKILDIHEIASYK